MTQKHTMQKIFIIAFIIRLAFAWYIERPFHVVNPAYSLLHPQTAVHAYGNVKMLQYVRSTWLQHAIWAPANVSAYGQQVRTNNDVEGWHRRLNARARRGDLPFYVTVRLLQDEAKQVSRFGTFHAKKYGQIWKFYTSGVKDHVEVTSIFIVKQNSTNHI